jgi:hypothetical protein
VVKLIRAKAESKSYPVHSIAAGHRANYLFNCILSPATGYFFFKNENVKVKVKYGFVLHTGLSFAI